MCIRYYVKDKIASFYFKGTWKHTTLSPHKEPKIDKDYEQYRKLLLLPGFYSKFLYNKWYRATVPMNAFDKVNNDIDIRVNLTVSEFIEQYEKPNKPVIIRGAMNHWKAMKKWSLIDNMLIKNYGDTLFKTNGTDDNGKTFKMTMKQYLQYALNNQDEKPIYLFDNKFYERGNKMLEEYEIEEYFKKDLFEYMKEEDRPDYRWILVGGSRSGSPLHQDPHRTSAWNALICGKKRWTLYLPNVIPPGVDEDLIDTEYYASPDVMKWFINIYPHITNDINKKPIQVIQEPGDIIFVPSGWWHQVLNLEPSVAVTQNYCNSQNFKFVYTDILERGSDSLKKDFIRDVSVHFPHLFADFPEYVNLF